MGLDREQMVKFPLTQSFGWGDILSILPLPIKESWWEALTGRALPAALCLIRSRIKWLLEGLEPQSPPSSCDHPVVAAGRSVFPLQRHKVPSLRLLLQACSRGAGQSLPWYPTLQIFLDSHHSHALSQAQLMPACPAPACWLSGPVSPSPCHLPGSETLLGGAEGCGEQTPPARHPHVTTVAVWED